MKNQLIMGDRTYSFGTIPAVEAVRVEIAIARVIGEPLFKAMTENDGKDVEAVGASVIGLLTSRMDADELLAVMGIVFNHTSANGQRIEINSTFTGRNRELWQVFVGALRFNFQDFFDALSSILPGDTAQKSNPSNPLTSTGT
jgi:hypothetical protein